MGTRADFYVGRGVEAEWLGSIAWDGYPDGIDAALLEATTEERYKACLEVFFSGRDDVTTPDMGWPWPWNDSKTTDYAYAFDDGKVWSCPFGHGWLDPLVKEPEDVEGSEFWENDKPTEFPDMSKVQNVTLGRRSGIMIF